MNKMKKLIVVIMLLFMGIVLTGCDFSTDINIMTKTSTMKVGDVIGLEVSSEDAVIWDSSNDELATVDENGIVTALDAGTVTISAAYGDNTSVINIIIKNDIDTNDYIELSGVQKILVGDSKKLTATYYGLEEEPQITWISSDTSVATVDSTGNVTGVTPGVTSITASTLNTSKSISIIITSGNGYENVISNIITNETFVLPENFDITSLSDKITTSINEVENAVIGVANYSEASDGSAEISSTGSGVIYKKVDNGNGTYTYNALTNNHVTEDSFELKAFMGYDDVKISATLLRADSEVDLAIIQFTYTKDITPVEFAEADSWETGNFVIAIGSADGFDYFNTSSFGIISQAHRELTGEEAKFIQHDAPINPGNSGGGLFNLDGELIGINTLKVATIITSDLISAEGMGFAVDLTTVETFLAE
ncbi:MAG: trypsin-like peptidase domain-containing protein [Bacilli bacterium]